MAYYSSYGQMIAAQRAKKRFQQKATTTARTRTLTNFNAPALDWHPAFHTIGEFANLPWDDKVAWSVVDQLLAGYDAGHMMQLLMLPTGVGKTAIAVRLIAQLSRDAGHPIPAIIVAQRKIVDSNGWQETIISYNNAHPDELPLNIQLIDTYDRFANAIKHPDTLQQVVSALGKDGVIIMDEVHNYKSPTSKRSKQLARLKPWKKLGLSATPLTCNTFIFDACSYLIFDNVYSSKSDFLTKHKLNRFIGEYGQLLVYDDRGRVIPSLWPTYSEFLAQLSHILVRPSISVPDSEMPNVQISVHQLEHDEQLTADLQSLWIAKCKRMFDAPGDYALACIERICIDPSRIATCLKLCENAKQPLIFYWHTSVREALCEAFKAINVVPQIIAGGFPLSAVDINEISRPILIQYAAGSEGIEFTHSNTTIFFENQWSHIKLVQARGRNVRRGMTGQITQHYLLSDCPFDAEIFNRVRAGEELTYETLDSICDRSQS